MTLPARARSLLRNLLRRQHVERDLDEELRAHVDLLADEKAAAGLSPAQARRAAQMEVAAEQVKEDVRAMRAGALLEQFGADACHAGRVLRRNPGFAAVAILTLALGIGATTAIFSVVYGVLLRPLPYTGADRLVELREVSAKGNRMSFADPNFEDVRTQGRALEGAAEYAWWRRSVAGGSEPARTFVAYVSRDFFPLMRVQPVLGRGFGPDDQRFGAAPVALVSHSYWTQRLGATRDLGRLKLTIENQAAWVVGVLPDGFRFPGETDIWLARETLERYPSRTAHNWHVIAKLRAGASLAQARSELSAVAARLKRQYGPDTMMVDVAAIPLQESLTSSARPALVVLLGAVGFLLLIACANVANLLLAQAAARERELATRAALGAGRRRLVRQFLTEALVLAASGAVLGVTLAAWGVRLLTAMAPASLPRREDVSISLPVLLFALGLCLLVAAGLGIFTALRATSGDVHRPLAEGGRGEAGTARAQRTGRALIAAQFAITLALLVGAGLLGRSLLRVLAVEPGFRTDHVTTLDLAMAAPDGPAEETRRIAFIDELLARLRRAGDVQEVGGTSVLPLAGGFLADGVYRLMAPGERVPATIAELEPLLRDPERVGDADYVVASAGYFRALSIPLLRGRLFDARDDRDAPHAALISASLARERFAGQDPLGRLVEFGNMDGDLRPLTIVGVVGDVRSASLESRPRPTIYVNYRQRPQATAQFTVVVRAAAPPPAIIPAARDIVRALDPNVPPAFNTFARIVTSSVGSRRFSVTLLAAFAGAALLLAMAGIYGVMTYSVARRTREIGVRMALGAPAGAVRRLLLRQGMQPAAAGLVIGLAGSLVLTRALRSLLFGLAPVDPITFIGVAVLLALVACLAAYLPVRRATRADPTEALRHE